jgi:hypothetical protein
LYRRGDPEHRRAARVSSVGNQASRAACRVTTATVTAVAELLDTPGAAPNPHGAARTATLFDACLGSMCRRHRHGVHRVGD